MERTDGDAEGESWHGHAMVPVAPDVRGFQRVWNPRKSLTCYREAA